MAKDVQSEHDNGPICGVNRSENRQHVPSLRGFGPLRTLHDRLGEAGRRALKQDVDAYHDYKVEAGLHVRREYPPTIGRRP